MIQVEVLDLDGDQIDSRSFNTIQAAGKFMIAEWSKRPDLVFTLYIMEDNWDNYGTAIH